jgi:hypothetical protein
VVLYNGEENYPDKKILRLSDAFIEESKQNLELIVKVLNINHGHNTNVLDKSENLSGYAALIERIRENQKSGTELKEAIDEAVIYCRRQRILYDFLGKYGGDIVSMLYTEWNLDDAKKIWLEDGMTKGAMAKAIEMAREMLNELGLSVSQVAKVTKLSEEEIRKLK